MLRCTGAAELGAVLVDGGAEYVMLPRLPNELPPPARASTTAGESARAKAATPARRIRVRGILFALKLVPAQYGVSRRPKPGEASGSLPALGAPPQRSADCLNG